MSDRVIYVSDEGIYLSAGGIYLSGEGIYLSDRGIYLSDGGIDPFREGIAEASGAIIAAPIRASRHLVRQRESVPVSRSDKAFDAIAKILLGIRIERIVPGHPERRTRTEESHLEGRNDSAARLQQRASARDVRPEAAHDDLQAEPQPYPESLPPHRVRPPCGNTKVACNGVMRWKSDRIFVSKTFADEWVGLEEIDDGIWSHYHGPALQARFDEHELFYG
jgi:hypothetical protein